MLYGRAISVTAEKQKKKETLPRMTDANKWLKYNTFTKTRAPAYSQGKAVHDAGLSFRVE